MTPEIAETPVSDATPASAVRRRPGPATALPWLLALVLVALLVTAGWLAYDARERDRSAAAASVGREAATTFFTLDPADVDSSIDRLLDLSTGQFRSDYAEQRDALIEQVRSKGISVTATVPEQGLALEHLTRTRSQVLVAVDTTTSLPDGSAETDNYRVRVLLSLVDDRWLVSGLEQVG